MENLSGRYQLASSDVACEEFDGEMVVLNLATGAYFSLNPSATRLFRCILAGHALEHLAAVRCGAYDAAESMRFFAALAAQGLIVADGSRPPLPAEAASAAGLDSSTEKPVIEIHEDMADLILADPIHDTDESVGWPATARAA